MSENLTKKIKSKGYWKIDFKPLVDIKDRIEHFPDLEELIEKNSVELRGWDYPHFPRRERPLFGNDYIEGRINWENHIELWRFYQSGRFWHYLALREDWFGRSSLVDKRLSKIKPREIISIIGTVYQLTEIYEFLSRLNKESIYKDGVEISINLNNTKNRRLELLEPGRAPLFQKYKTNAKSIKFSRSYSEKEIAEKSQELALEAILHFFYRFGWNNPPIEVIKEDQRKLLERRA